MIDSDDFSFDCCMPFGRLKSLKNIFLKQGIHRNTGQTIIQTLNIEFEKQPVTRLFA